MCLMPPPFGVNMCPQLQSLPLVTVTLPPGEEALPAEGVDDREDST